MSYSLLLSLDSRLSSSHALKPKNELGDIVVFQAFPQLEIMLTKVGIGKVKKEKQPNSERIVKAIQALFTSPEKLSDKDWRYIFWGLGYEVNKEKILESKKYFAPIKNKIDDIVGSGVITKREWIALCSIYFSFESLAPNNDNWIYLRSMLVNSMAVLIKNQKKARPWLEVIKNNSFLLTERPEVEFSKLIIFNDSKRIAEINQVFPITDSSWLWRKTFSNFEAILDKVTDEKFVDYLNDLISLISTYRVHSNLILAALLTRYYKSSNRLITNNALKNIALDTWGSPQLKTSKNNWLVNVAPEVVNMVLRWFAKDDLEHFFKLLKTEEGVDQRRLNFWIDYVDQITFTKIVLGRDANYNNSLDFKNFRLENKGRLSELLSATSNNNAFIMRIKNFWFVEFSETGNACYVYEDSSLPFNPNDRRLDLKNELKKPEMVKEKIFHSGDWETKANYILRKLNIYK